MATETTTQLVSYDISEAQIAKTREACADLTADTTQGYEQVRQAIANLRDTRGAIERRRVQLKADALAYGRMVDAEAKRFTTLLLEIEDPLKAKKAAIDDEKARIKAEAEAEKARAIEAEIKANLERQEAERRAEREAEEACLAAERAALDAERQRLDEDRRRLDEAARVEREAAEAKLASDRAALAEERRQAEDRDRVAREALESERRKIAAEREQAERAEFERLAKINAEREAAEQLERDRLAAAERQARLDALRPDLEKVAAFAAAIRALVPPKPRSKEAKAMIAAAVEGLNAVACVLAGAAEKAA